MTLPTCSFVLSSGAATLMVVAAVSDLRRFTIPNWIVLSLIGLYGLRVAVAAAAGASITSTILPVAPALAVFAIGAVAFHRGWLGGGDVKLLAAVTLWMPVERALDFLTLVALLGGALAALALGVAWFVGPALVGSGTSRPLTQVRLPYGVAISVAGALMLFNLANL